MDTSRYRRSGAPEEQREVGPGVDEANGVRATRGTSEPRRRHLDQPLRPPHALLAAHLSEEPPPLHQVRADVPAALASLVMRCLEKDADRRPQNAQQILTALEDPAVLSGELTPTTITGAIAERARSSRRQRIVLVAAVVASVIACWMPL